MSPLNKKEAKRFAVEHDSETIAASENIIYERRRYRQREDEVVPLEPHQSDKDDEIEDDGEDDDVVGHSGVDPEAYFYWILGTCTLFGIVMVLTFLSIGNGPFVPGIKRWVEGDLTVFPEVFPPPKKFQNILPSSLRLRGANRYEFFAEEMSFDDAISLCKAREAHLLGVRTAAENKFITAWIKRLPSNEVVAWTAATVKNETTIDNKGSTFSNLCADWSQEYESLTKVNGTIVAVVIDLSAGKGCWRPLAVHNTTAVRKPFFCIRKNIVYEY